MQDRLLRAADGLGHVSQTQPAGRSVRDDAPTDVICNPDTPWESAKLWGAELPRVWRLS